MFGRRKARDAEGEPADARDDDAAVEPAETSDEPAASAVPATSGPWDVGDAPDDSVERVDLGGVHVPVPDGGELRVDVDPETQTAQAVLVVVGQSVLQIGAFAAPKTQGIWAEVADEIVAGIRQAGGTAEPAQGPFGRELRAVVPTEDEHGHRGQAPTRFLGVDGPRWFLRGLLQGPAADNPGAAGVFEDVFRSIVVVRGGEAMAPRDPLPLRLPRDVVPGGTPEPEAESATETEHIALDPFTRGPEITEIR